MKKISFLDSFLEPRRLVLVFGLLGSPALMAAESSHFGWVSVLPPVIAIVLALALRQVVPALFVGIWVGAWALKVLKAE